MGRNLRLLPANIFGCTLLVLTTWLTSFRPAKKYPFMVAATILAVERLSNSMNA